MQLLDRTRIVEVAVERCCLDGAACAVLCCSPPADRSNGLGWGSGTVCSTATSSVASLSVRGPGWPNGVEVSATKDCCPTELLMLRWQLTRLLVLFPDFYTATLTTLKLLKKKRT